MEKQLTSSDRILPMAVIPSTDVIPRSIATRNLDEPERTSGRHSLHARHSEERSDEESQRKYASNTSHKPITAIFATITVTLCAILTACAPPRPNHPVIGAKNFTEQVVLGELLAQEIEAKSNLQVERRFYLAGSYICQQAMVAGRIDGYVEYTGTALTAILKQPLDRDPQRVLDTVRRLYASRYNITVAPPLGFENTFAMVIRGDDARRLHLAAFSQAAPYTPQWRLGVGYEFEQRPDGLPGLSATYGLKFAGSPRTMDLGLLYRALNAGQVDMIAGNSTDGPIQAFGLTVLQDDKHYFPPYQAVPLVREEALRRWPQIQTALDALAGRITADDMRTMNQAVDGQHRDPAEVVREFRKKKGL
ncbi:osmoprotectant transport system substrate-binding protein [Silvibacterium bohemicum]|uniref:Osmoprotectant transport system substrate-binding protein n=2 Tax=Silvibacterium bohemicum TaxID=1577686 RepID=A0A841JRT3_9BACT|nr:osmoprotectant transport system substrate-binding protein [Silvibacterium bohemicum]